MKKLSANMAAKEAGIAKKTLLEAITSNRMTAEKNAKGHWEIDPAELFRVFPKSSGAGGEKTVSHPPSKTSENNGLEVEVRMLREKMTSDEAKSERERAKLVDEIENLRSQLSESRQDYRQTLAVIEDMRPKQPDAPKRGFWARLTG